MGTTADKLALLQRTKERQRAYLEQKYPLLDFDNIPFRAYLDLFQGRSYVPGFVGGWKAYGRSNDEADGQRNFLRDYSGNGRDIELFNLGWTEDSGYNTTTYPGALVSDGVDDYGQCIKGFSLPDDYTVVAVRKIIQGNIAALVSKGSSMGAFLFDATNNNINVNLWSYGGQNSLSRMPALFSYQMKASYNGNTITYGTQEDTDADLLKIFNHNNATYASAALYDLRIYDHSLTAEELETVKDEMMTDYENATGGGIADITYIADWDAKGRSNDEEEPMRSQWTDKATGKVINLSNYSFSQMSGWGGFRFDWSGWASDINSSGGEVIREKNKVTVKNFGNYPSWTIINRSTSALGGTLPAFTVRVSGLKEGASLQFNAAGKSALLLVHSDGIYSIPEDSSNPTYYAFVAFGYSADEAANLVIEQLPVYPGALVSDGVDDHGVSADTFSEEIGTMLGMWRRINLTQSGYVFNLGLMSGLPSNPEYQGAIGAFYNSPNNVYSIGNPKKNAPESADSIYWLTRTPEAQNAVTLKIQEPAEPLSCALYRLMFVKEQLDGAQVEFLKWKVEKEYRDWCKANGYEYAITEMLNN